MPEVWAETSLGQHTYLTKGITYTSFDYCSREDGHVFLTIKSVEKGGGFNQDGLKYYRGAFGAEQALKQGDLVIALTDLTRAGDIVGGPMLVPHFGAGVVLPSMDLASLRPLSRNTNLSFIFYRLMLQDARRYMLAHSGGTTVLHLETRAVPNFRFRAPSPIGQARIARILSTVDEAIEQSEALVAKTQKIKAGLMQDLLTRGVTADGRLRPLREQAPQLYKESPLGWIPTEWAIRSLSELASVNRGKFTIRPRNDPRYYGGPYPFIQTGDVAFAAGRVLTKYSQTLNELGLTVSRLFPAGTIMVTIAAHIADTCILGIPVCAPDSLVGVNPNTGELARYLELCISARKRWFENRAPQTAQKNINLEDLRPLLIPCPHPQEQMLIAQRYQAIDAQLHDLLTGRVPATVRVAARDSR
jgi:type I restriction enzyme S subunit